MAFFRVFKCHGVPCTLFSALSVALNSLCKKVDSQWSQPSNIKKSVLIFFFLHFCICVTVSALSTQHITQSSDILIGCYMFVLYKHHQSPLPFVMISVVSVYFAIGKETYFNTSYYYSQMVTSDLLVCLTGVHRPSCSVMSPFIKNLWI